jgi:transketolase
VLIEGGSLPRQVTLLATGSEVDIALKAREQLEAQGISTAVISMPCWELFDAQPESYRNQVLCPETRTVAIEAAVKFGWERYLGSRGRFVGMSDYGLSGPADELYRHFGITPEAVVQAAGW